MTTSDGPRAGWYGDGVTPGAERWFDGRAWTEHLRPAPGAAGPAPRQHVAGPSTAQHAAGPSAAQPAAHPVPAGPPATVQQAVLQHPGGGPAPAVRPFAAAPGAVRPTDPTQPGAVRPSGLGQPRPAQPGPAQPGPAQHGPAHPGSTPPGAVRPQGAAQPGPVGPGGGPVAPASAPAGWFAQPGQVHPYPPQPSAAHAAQPAAHPGLVTAGGPPPGFPVAAPTPPTAPPVAARPGAAPGWGAPPAGASGGTWSTAGTGPRPGAAYPSASTAAWGGTANLAPWGPPRLAHWGWRVLARLVDEIAVSIPYTVAVVLDMVAATGAADPTLALAQASEGTSTTAMVGLLLTFVLWVANRVVAQGRTGRSLGKRVCGLRLVKRDTMQPVGLWWAFVRDVGHVVDQALLGLGYLWPLWDAQRQTFSDKLCRTVVVREG